MKFVLETIPHDKQRYETVGDWIPNESEDGSGGTIRVSDMGNDDYAFMVGIHEMIKFYLCSKKGVTDETVTAFDTQYEADREKGLHGPDEEPGDDPGAPYKSEHFFATTIERQLCDKLGIDWNEYDKTVMSL
jgi:hypothetical protein